MMSDSMLIGCFGSEDYRQFAFFSATWTLAEMLRKLLDYHDRYRDDWHFREHAAAIEIISVPLNTSIYEEDWDETTILDAGIDWTWTDDDDDTVSTLTVDMPGVPREMTAEIIDIVVAWNAKEAAKNIPAAGGDGDA